MSDVVQRLHVYRHAELNADIGTLLDDSITAITELEAALTAAQAEVERLKCVALEEYKERQGAVLEKEQAEQENAKLRAALQELVACKNLKDQAQHWREYCSKIKEPAGSMNAGVMTQEMLRLLDRAQSLDSQYERRKPLAWAAARAALSEQTR